MMPKRRRSEYLQWLATCLPIYLPFSLGHWREMIEIGFGVGEVGWVACTELLYYWGIVSIVYGEGKQREKGGVPDVAYKRPLSI
jgi:hypothetical protein